MDTTYIYDTHSLYVSDGELHILYDNDKQIIFDIENLYKDLPHIVAMVHIENRKQQKLYKKQLKQALKSI